MRLPVPAATRRPYLVAVGALILIATGRLLAVVHEATSRLVNEDQASLWLAGQELIRTGRLRQPTFPGQSYGTPFEGIGSAVLGLLHMPPWWGLPLTLGALSYGGFLAVAWAARRNAAPGAALMAAGAPLLFATYPLFLLTSYGTALGRFLAAVAAALAWGGRSLRSAVAALTCACLALAFDTSTLLLLLPAAVLALPARRDLLTPRFAGFLVAAMLPAVAWTGLRSWYAHAHPDFAVNPSPPLRPEWSVAGRVLSRLPHYGDAFAPSLVPSGGAALLVFAAIAAAVIAVAITCRAHHVLLAVVAASVVLLAGLGTERAQEDVSVFLPASRVLLSLPLLALLLLAAAERAAGPRLRRRAVVVSVLALLAVSGAAAFARGGGQAKAILAAAPSAPVVPQVSVAAFEARCDRLARMVEQSKADVVVFTDDRAMAYGCPAIAAGDYATLYPPYEKRTWRLYEEQRRRPYAIVVWGRDCSEPAGLACTPLGTAPPVSRIAPGGLTTMEVVRRLGIVLRSYGGSS